MHGNNFTCLCACSCTYLVSYLHTYHGPMFLHIQAQLDEQLVGLQTLTAARRSKLQESIKLHQYIRDVDEVLSWLSEKQTIAASDDYGKDFEHLLVRILLACIIFELIVFDHRCCRRSLKISRVIQQPVLSFILLLTI